MVVIFIILMVGLCLLSFCVKSEYKIGILLSSLMLLTLVELPVLGNHAHTFVFLSVILSEYKKYGLYLKKLHNPYLLAFLAVILVSGIICMARSPFLWNFSSMIGFILSEYVLKAFSLIYGFLLTRNGKTLGCTCRLTSLSLYFMTFFAVLNLIMGYSMPVDSMYSGSLDGYNFSSASRFRVQATILNPFDYGFICLICFFIHLHAYFLKQVNKSVTIICLACCLFGIFTCNCRTILFCFLVGIVLYFLLTLKISRKTISNIIIVSVLLVSLILVSPSLQHVFFSVFSIFDTNSTVDGSSMSARLVQLMTVFYYIKDDLLFGRGVLFFREELGWGESAESAYDHDLLGLEGNYLSILLERGIVGMVIFVMIIAILAGALIRYRKYGKMQFALGMTVFVVYLLFGTMTGELLSTPPSYLVIGFAFSTLVAKSIESRDEDIEHKEGRNETVSNCNSCL